MKQKRSKSLTELLIEYDKIQRDLEALKSSNSKIIEKKVAEIWGNRSKGLTDNQRQQLNNILEMI